MIFILYKLKATETIYSFTNKCVLVTGASSGIGFATVEQLLKTYKNMTLYLVSRSIQADDIFDTYLKSHLEDNNTITWIHGDLSSKQFISMLAKDIQKTNKIDVIIANAGISHSGTFQELCSKSNAFEVFDNIYNTNTHLIPLLCSLGEKIYSDKHLLKICVINSICGLVGLPEKTAYCTAKYALTGFCESLRMELRSQKNSNIELYEFFPGPVATNIDISRIPFGDKTKNMCVDPSTLSAHEAALKILNTLTNTSKKGCYSLWMYSAYIIPFIRYLNQTLFIDSMIYISNKLEK